MEQMKQIKKEQNFPYWELRLGINTGPLVAGVIGEMKFAYDVFGDTVNTASRMESGGQAGLINISKNTYNYISEFFECSPRGSIEVKNKGKVEMYFLTGIKKEFCRDEIGRVPNKKFIEMYNQLVFYESKNLKFVLWRLIKVSKSISIIMFLYFSFVAIPSYNTHIASLIIGIKILLIINPGIS